jgi:hypothetical protein
MAEIFVSYAAEDRDRARQLAGALETLGWSVWWDREIPLGRHYDDVIERALAESRCAIVLWSRTSIASEWVRTEASEAKRRGILVPAFIEPVNPPLAFRLLQGADLGAWTPGASSEEFDALTRRVAELVSHPTAGLEADGPPVPSGGRSPAPPVRSWWPAVAAAALALVAAVLLIGVYRGMATKTVGVNGEPSARVADKPADNPKGPSPPAPSPEPSRSLPDPSPANPKTGDITDLAAWLKAFTPQAGALTAFELKELNVKVVYVTGPQAQTVGLPAGAVVMAVDAGPALTAGLQAGDVITAVGGDAITSIDDFRRILRGVGRGTTRYGIRRSGRDLTLDIECSACTDP